MPLNKAFLYLDAISRKHTYKRKDEFIDLVAAISVSFSGKGYKEHLDSLGAENG